MGGRGKETPEKSAALFAIQGMRTTKSQRIPSHPSCIKWCQIRTPKGRRWVVAAFDDHGL